MCVGMAASMGAFLLAAGAKGKRKALPNAEIMIHQPLGGAQGQAHGYRDPRRADPAHQEKLNEILAKNTGKPLEVLEADAERDHFLTAEEARDYGTD